MILLVPVRPEVPRPQQPRLWPGLLFVLILGLVFLEAHPILKNDNDYVTQVQDIPLKKQNPVSEMNAYLRIRPFLKIAPAKDDWDLKRVLLANFLHGSIPHLFLNQIAIFAGARICSTFLPFLYVFSIFLLGGSIGIWGSMVFSSDPFPYIPHLGASAGIFALMGTYYVYNFRYRTKYFFWFPSRHGIFTLRTSWFFFIDVILLELVLSVTQFFPARTDNVDHLAHVFGFGCGVLIALVVRALQQWPGFLQTRLEFLHWSKLTRPGFYDPVHFPIAIWLKCLQMNPYNDQLKSKLCRAILLRCEQVTDGELAEIFDHFCPTFMRLYPDIVGVCLKTLLSKQRKIPQRWLKRVPYDIVIRLARAMADPVEDQKHLYEFIVAYRNQQAEGADHEGQIELLMRKLSPMVVGAPAKSARIQ